MRYKDIASYKLRIFGEKYEFCAKNATLFIYLFLFHGGNQNTEFNDVNLDFWDLNSEQWYVNL